MSNQRISHLLLSISIISTASTHFHNDATKKRITKNKTEHVSNLQTPNRSKKGSIYLFDERRVLIGFSFNPMLSGERSSGAIQVGLSGLLGLPLN